MRISKAPMGTPMITDPKAGAIAPAWTRWLNDLSNMMAAATTPTQCWNIVGAARVAVTSAVFVCIGCLCLITIKTDAAPVTITMPHKPMMDTPYFDGVIWRTIPAGSTTVTFPAACTAQVQFLFLDEVN